jgi:metal-responsive CopG/Arc/MetJ family transcriptional regulator
MKENPRYNVISVRIDDDLAKRLNRSAGKNNRGDFVRAEIEEKLKRLNDSLQKESTT